MVVGCANLFGCVPASKDQVIAFGDYVKQAGVPFQPLKIGAMLESVDSAGNATRILAEGIGMKVVAVSPGSRAASAGLQIGDVIRSLNGTRIRNEDDWQAFISKVGPGDSLTVVLQRTGKDIQITMSL
jgi:serine protease Do